MKRWLKDILIFVVVLFSILIVIDATDYLGFKFIVAFAFACIVVDFYLRRGKPLSVRTYSIQAWNAILRNKRFGEITGIKSAIDGNNYDNWSKEDKEKYLKDKKLPKLVGSGTDLTLIYLPSDDVYFIEPRKLARPPYIVHRNNSASNCLYSTVVAGDQDMNKEHLLFSVYERKPKGIFAKNKPVLSICLIYRRNSMDIKQELSVLCDFPIFEEDNAKNMGFEVEKGFADVSEDIFGQQDLMTFPPSYTKNGVNISIID